MDLQVFVAGIAIIVGAVGLGVVLFTRIGVFNEESHELLQLRFGKLVHRATEAGYANGTRLRPWDRWIAASRQWDQRFYRDIEINDSQGTIMKVDLRVTFRIVDAERALFAVTDWEEALESSTLHDAAALLANRDRALFLRNAPELSDALTASLSSTLAGYGIEIGEVQMLDVEFRPEVARQMFEAVAAKLEVAKAENEEKGRSDAALLLARTEQRVAELEARAKTEGLKAVGRAYEDLRTRPEIFAAYTALYRLSQLDPEKIVSFDGFQEALSSSALVESDLELDKHAGAVPS